MARTNYRNAYRSAAAFIGAAVLATFGTTARARAEATVASDVKATMQCDRAGEPGRVRCTIEVRVEGGRALAWADLAIVSLPDFASALKGRIGPDDTVSRDATSAKWAFGLVARRAGQGEVRARVRVVACEAGRCAPVTVEVKTLVTVGG